MHIASILLCLTVIGVCQLVLYNWNWHCNIVTWKSFCYTTMVMWLIGLRQLSSGQYRSPPWCPCRPGPQWWPHRRSSGGQSGAMTPVQCRGPGVRGCWRRSLMPYSSRQEKLPHWVILCLLLCLYDIKAPKINPAITIHIKAQNEGHFTSLEVCCYGIDLGTSIV